MKKRTALILLAALIFALTTVSISPRRAQAQFPTQFGAQRFPAIDVDKNDKLYLATSTATGTDRPHSQIFFASSGDGGKSWSNFPQTKNLTKSQGEAFGPSLVVTKQGTPRAYIVYHDDSPGVTEAFLLRAKKKAKFKK